MGGMYSDDYEGVPLGIMSIFTEARTGSKAFAYIITILVSITIFGSTFAMMCGFGYLPYAAARDGYFFSFFAHRSKRFSGLADYSLLTVGLLSAAWCFFSLDLVIDAMTTMLVLVMFCGQSIGLVWYKYRTPKEEQPDGWEMPLFPLPCILQFVIFFFIFITTDSVLLWGDDDPILEISVLFLFLGAGLFLVRSKIHQTWPFNVEGSDVKGKEGETVADDPKKNMTKDIEGGDDKEKTEVVADIPPVTPSVQV